MNSHDERYVHFLNTCSEILFLEGKGALGSVSRHKRAAWRATLLEQQDPASGLFQPAPLASRRPTPAGDLPVPTFRLTYLALQALDALNAAPQHPLHFLQNYADGATLEAWLQALEWRDPRDSAEQVHSLLFFLLFQAERSGDTGTFARFHQILDWLDQNQPPETGLWGSLTTMSLHEAAVASGLLLPFYEYVHRPVQRLNRMLQAVLALMDGRPVAPERRDTSGNLAFVYLLATLYEQTAQASDDLREALVATHRHLSHREEAATDGDATKHWLRAQLLALVETVLPDDFPTKPRWQFRRWPAPVYRRTVGEMDGDERATLLHWQRPLPEVEPGGEAPFVSIVIPCYNLGRYLYEAISSVLAQTMNRLEIIVVDDGSTDAFTTLLLSELAHPGVQVICQDNKGVAAARNTGIEQAQAPYICCLDPDDRLRATYFEQAVGVLQEQPDVALVTGYFQMFDERDDLFQVPACTLPDMLVYNQAIQASVFRRQVWQEAGGYYGGFSENGVEDWDLWLSILERGWKAHLIPEVVCDYRIRATQMSERMYEPAVWQQLRRELALRHQESYMRHLPEVMGISGFRWATDRRWISERNQAILWWQRQAQYWRQVAEEQEQYIEELRTWIAELEEARAWLEGQVGP